LDGEPVSIDAADPSAWVRRDGRWLCALHTGSITSDPSADIERPRLAELRSRGRRTRMTTKADYTDEEWIRLRRAPFVAGLAISMADPGGPIEMAKETMATLRAATTPPTREELLVAVSQEIASMMNQKQNPLAGFKPESAALAGKMVLDELEAVNEILTAKATPEEADAFRRWLMAVSRAAADAAKEGGFMGFGAELVSQGEQRMLGELRVTLGMPEA
jgi:hypothetical protein